VDTATQNNIFSPEAAAADAGASAAISALPRSISSLFFVTVSATPPPSTGPPATPKAAAAPTDSKNFRRVCICSLLNSPEV
jgi:hypothetical protein